MTDKKQGLHCSVLSDQGSRYDCTNGGISSGRKSLTLVADGVRGPFEPDEEAPEVTLLYDLEPKGARAGYLMVAKPDWLARIAGSKAVIGEYECMGSDWASRHQIVNVRVVPVIDGKPKSGMFGGNYLSTSDSRFPVIGPIPIFDRFE